MKEKSIANLSKGEKVKQRLLDMGRIEIMKTSFNAVGIASISKAADLPKGSFYYYFPSKEKFGLELFENYMKEYFQDVESYLSVEKNATKNAYQRIESLHKKYYRNHKADGWKITCFFMKVYPEVGVMSKPIRKVIRAGIDKIVKLYGETVRLGLEEGSIVNREYSAEELGKGIFLQWKSAALITSVYETGEHLDDFFKYLEKICGKK